MKKSRLAPIAAPASILLRIIVVILSVIAVAWTCIFYTLWDAVP